MLTTEKVSEVGVIAIKYRILNKNLTWRNRIETPLWYHLRNYWLFLLLDREMFHLGSHDRWGCRGEQVNSYFILRNENKNFIHYLVCILCVCVAWAQRQLSEVSLSFYCRSQGLNSGCKVYVANTLPNEISHCLSIHIWSFSFLH